MISAIANALTGLNAASLNLEKTAHNVANFASNDGNIEIETEIVDLIKTSTLFKANLNTIGVAEDMLGALLDREI